MAITASSTGECAACKCKAQDGAPLDWAFVMGLVFGRMGASMTFCEKHSAMVDETRESLLRQFGQR